MKLLFTRMQVAACLLLVNFWVFLLPISLRAADRPHSGFDGTYRGRVISELLRHQQGTLARKSNTTEKFTVKSLTLRDDVENIAILDDSSGVVLRPNDFDLNQLSIVFHPVDSGYTVESKQIQFEDQAQDLGSNLGLSDDDAVSVVLPFQFPFFGENHETIWVHSDGNLSFIAPDSTSDTRSFSRAASGPPRIAPLFTDLDPSQSDAKVTEVRTSDRVVFTWDEVPEYSFLGDGRRQTFQVVLYRDGRIDFHYLFINLSSMIVGIMPGSFRDEASAVDFSEGTDNFLVGALAEIFTQAQGIDPIATVQKFYRNHDDTYDFIILFNDFDLEAGLGAFAYELNVRNEVEGIGSLQPNGNQVFDFGKDFGSDQRLQSFINMGPLSNYLDDPKEIIPALGENSTLSILGHEAGHRFLAFTNFLDPISGAISTKMLGRDAAHWSFFFNSDASVVEGNRITDHGTSSPRFETISAVEKFSDIDQYLMGLREADNVAPSFFVDNPSDSRSRESAPELGVTFDGIRREIDVDMIIAAEGARRPQQSVAQKEFNFAFLLLVGEGETPSSDTLEKLNRIRTEFGTFFRESTDQLGTAHTGLVKKLHLSTWPAAGVSLGGSAIATVSIENPLTGGIDVALSSENGFIETPPNVTINAGEKEASFHITGLESGITSLNAHVLHSDYDVARTIVRVKDKLDGLILTVGSGDSQESGEGGMLPLPVTFLLRDEDKLHYSGLAVKLVPNGDGIVTPSRMVTDASGRISVQWRLASDTVFNVLRAELEDAPGVQVTATAVVAGIRPNFSAIGVVNAASFNTDGATETRVFTPGGLYSIFGSHLTAAPESGWAPTIPLPRELAGAVVSINGVVAPLLFVSDRQINLMAPFDLPNGEVEISIISAAGRSETVNLPVRGTQPGIFFDSRTNFGAILNNLGLSVISTPPERGEVVQIFATGLGLVNPPVVTGTGAPLSPLSITELMPTVKIGDQSAEIMFSGLAPLFVGLYQVNAKLPEDLDPGIHPLQMESQGVFSNSVLLEVR